MQFDWQILDLESSNGVITSVQYQVSGTDGDVSLSTQGHWYFKPVEVPSIPFDNVTRNDILDWLKHETTKNGVNLIESNLEKQLESLKAQSKKKMPWDSAVFKPFA